MIAGYVLGKVEGKAKDWHGHVTALAVAPPYRRRGLAAALMAELETVSAKAHDAFYVDLFVRASNAAAIGMYEKVKMRKKGRRDRRRGAREGDFMIEALGERNTGTRLFPPLSRFSLSPRTPARLRHLPPGKRVLFWRGGRPGHAQGKKKWERERE